MNNNNNSSTNQTLIMAIVLSFISGCVLKYALNDGSITYIMIAVALFGATLELFKYGYGDTNFMSAPKAKELILTIVGTVSGMSFMAYRESGDTANLMITGAILIAMWVIVNKKK